MAHDFKKFPELRNDQLSEFYFESPHKQVFESFRAQVTKVNDGDTISVRWSERDFDFKVRFVNIAAPELSEDGGQESKSWLEKEILGEDVDIIINPKKRVGKWGRLIGNVLSGGLDVGDMSIIAGKSIPWEDRVAGSVPSLDVELRQGW